MTETNGARSIGLNRVDNIIRQRLMISDPTNPEEVARGLERTFKEGAARIAADRSGYATAPVDARAPATAVGATDYEYEQAKSDVEADLTALVSDARLKDIRPELEGWQRALTEIVTRGSAAARSAIDESERSAAFAARQELGDYARLARLLGALTPELNGTYRNLAKSLDEASSVILVLAGEAIAARGFGGVAALPARVGELQARRDAVLGALRVLLGVEQQSYGVSEWPRGLQALNALQDLLDRSGHGYLKSYVTNDQYLAAQLDRLLERGGTGDARLLRGVSASATVTLGQIERLLTLMEFHIDPESPPLATFRQALRLFINSFRPDRGRRLILAARSPLVGYGLYGVGPGSEGDERILRLLVTRGGLASRLDCFLGCGCGTDAVTCQVVLDKLLYDLDRAIDRYLQDATAADNEPEQRAAAYGLLALMLRLACGEDISLAARSGALMSWLVRSSPGEAEAFAAAWEQGGFVRLAGLQACCEVDGRLDALLDDVAWELTGPVRDRLWPVADAPVAVDELVRRLDDALGVPGTVPAPALRAMRDEICLQRRSESKWWELARGMAPSCEDVGRLEQTVDQLLKLTGAVTGLAGPDFACPQRAFDLPPHHETSLGGLVYGRRRDGEAAPSLVRQVIDELQSVSGGGLGPTS